MKPIESSLRVGLTFDTREDFKFVSPNSEDWDAEFEVSTAIDDIAHALEDLGHNIEYIGSGLKLLDNFRKYTTEIDIIFNIAEGYLGRAREAQIPSMLELARIPYVGSDSYTLTLALNKWHTKILAMQAGIRTPEFQIIRNFDEIAHCKPKIFPVIAKLCSEGSSKCVSEDSVTSDLKHLHRMIEYLLRTYKQPVIVERFIEGREVDVPIIGTNPERVFGVVGITLDGHDLGGRFLTSKIVREDGYDFRYPLNEDFEESVEQSALKLYNLLECRDFGRVDERIDEDGVPYFLEINPYPFLGKHSSFNEIAMKSGLGYKNMIGRILDSAIQRSFREKERFSLADKYQQCLMKH
jgi:D-alanine-D-alanine ligase